MKWGTAFFWLWMAAFWTSYILEYRYRAAHPTPVEPAPEFTCVTDTECLDEELARLVVEEGIEGLRVTHWSTVAPVDTPAMVYWIHPEDQD
jgi:hypothetical protein